MLKFSSFDFTLKGNNKRIEVTQENCASITASWNDKIITVTGKVKGIYIDSKGDFNICLYGTENGTAARLLPTFYTFKEKNIIDLDILQEFNPIQKYDPDKARYIVIVEFKSGIEKKERFKFETRIEAELWAEHIKMFYIHGSQLECERIYIKEIQIE